jgi:hypothetical protein
MKKNVLFVLSPSGGQCIDMTKTEAIKIIRGQIKQLAAAAATECVTMRRGKGIESERWALDEFDKVASNLAAPALQALEVLQGGALQAAKGNHKKADKSRQ